MIGFATVLPSPSALKDMTQLSMEWNCSHHGTIQFMNTGEQNTSQTDYDPVIPFFCGSIMYESDFWAQTHLYTGSALKIKSLPSTFWHRQENTTLLGHSEISSLSYLSHPPHYITINFLNTSLLRRESMSRWNQALIFSPSIFIGHHRTGVIGLTHYLLGDFLNIGSLSYMFSNHQH